jgi:ADP-heptose:LPS heptosyltransferase
MRRVAIVRALQLGDVLCAVPALRSLRARYNDAHVTLIGLPWARELIRLLPRYLDALEEFPGFPGIPEAPFDARRTQAFVSRLQAQPFDLALQLHGSGSHINEFTLLLGARSTAVFYRDGDATPENGVSVPWATTGSEAQRLLALPLALGCPDTGLALELDVHDADRVALYALVGDMLAPRSYVCIHPGARFPSRRWIPERFAAIGDELAGRGFTVVLTGTASEAPLTTAVREAMRAASMDLTGALTLGTLAALVKDAALVVCNDTGMSHVAAAVATPSVVVASGSDVARWAPDDAHRHRVLWHDVACRPCMHLNCPTQHECAAGVSVGEVLAAAEQMLEREVLHV